MTREESARAGSGEEDGKVIPLSAGRIRIALVLVLAAVLLSYMHERVPLQVSFGVLVLGAVLVSRWPIEACLQVYTATLSVQMWLWGVGRVAVSDLFMVPAIGKAALEPRMIVKFLALSTFARPFASLALALGLGTVVGALEAGSMTGYVLVNKDLGFLYLIVGYMVLAQYLQTQLRIARMIHWFVVGVSVANVTSLIAAGLAFAGVSNELYLTGNMRLYGSMLSPNRLGGVVSMAALLELGRPYPSRWRGMNLWLLGLGLALTLSRGSWLSVGVGALALVVLQTTETPRRLPWRSIGVTTLWALIPLGAIAGVFRAAPPVQFVGAAQHAAELRERFLQACQQDPTLAICGELPPQQAVAPADRARLSEAGELPELLPFPIGTAPTAANAERSLTNSRGVDDRLAILAVAWDLYTASTQTIILGIGLGTFLDKSTAAFGLPLIIHNTFAWFLVEMGLLGLAAILWVWLTAALNLWRAHQSVDWQRAFAPGLIASLLCLTVFCLLNEGLYQRHLWLLFVLSDRLGAQWPSPSLDSSGDRY